MYPISADAIRSQAVGLAAYAGSSEALIRDHRDLVRRIAWHVHNRVSSAIELEDLIQTGLVALVEAARAYEDRGHAFATYASTRIRGAMIDQLRREARISRSGIAARRQIAQARAKLEQQLQRPPNEVEMAAALGMGITDYHAVAASAVAVEQDSIDEVYSDHESWFADLAANAEEQLADSQLRGLLAHSIASLQTREAQILQLFFMEEMNLHEIGEILGIGAARVCQIKKAALGKLRLAMAEAV
jgi:RNA polymerase sigma factor FliA